MLNINPWNMVMIVINLLVLYAIFRKFLYKPFYSLLLILIFNFTP